MPFIDVVFTDAAMFVEEVTSFRNAPLLLVLLLLLLKSINALKKTLQDFLSFSGRRAQHKIACCCTRSQFPTATSCGTSSPNSVSPKRQRPFWSITLHYQNPLKWKALLEVLSHLLIEVKSSELVQTMAHNNISDFV